MLSISYMSQPDYNRVNQDLLVKPRTQKGLEGWGFAYEKHHGNVEREMKLDAYGASKSYYDSKADPRQRSLLNQNEVQAKQRGIGEERVGNEDSGYESYDEEEESIYLVAKFIEVHEELLRYSGYNLWMLVEMCLYDKNIRANQQVYLVKVLSDIVKDSDLNIGNQISEALEVLTNARCGAKLSQHFAS